MAFDIIHYTPSAAVADNGSVTIPYPSGRSSADYASTGARLTVVATNADLVQDATKGFTVTYGGGNISVTNTADTPWPAGGEILLQAPLFSAADAVAALTAITTPDGSDAGTTQTLANACKAKINAIIAALQV